MKKAFLSALCSGPTSVAYVTPLCNFWLKGCISYQNMSPCRQEEDFFSSASLVPSVTTYLTYSMQSMCVYGVLSRFSRVQLFATLWTVARQAPLSMGFSRLDYWSGLPCPPPVDLPHPGIEPRSLASPDIGKWVLYHWRHPGSPCNQQVFTKLAC